MTHIHLIASVLEYKYLFLFFAILFTSETALLPAIYFVVIGRLGLVPVFLIALLGSLGADVLWYAVGYLVPFDTVKQWQLFNKPGSNLAKLSAVFEKNTWKIILYSKFVYGTRMIIQIISGLHKVNFGKYLVVNLVGTFAWHVLLFAVAIAVGGSVSAMTSAVEKLYVTAALFILLAIILKVAAAKYLKKNIYEE